MRIDVGDFCLFVGGDPLVLMMPLGDQEADGSADQLGQVTIDVSGVLSAKFDLARKREVIANEDASTCHDSGGKGFVMAVAQAQHPAVIRIGMLRVNLHQAEVALSLVGQGMSLCPDAQAGGRKRLLNGADELMVWNGMPAGGGARCMDSTDLLQVHGFGTAMKNQVGAAARRQDNGGFLIELSNHGVVFLG